MSTEKPKEINRAFQSILDYMMEEDRSDLYNSFLEKNGQLDELRHEKNPEKWMQY